MDDDVWVPVDEQQMVGIAFVFAKPDMPVGLEVGLMHSSDEGSTSGSTSKAEITDLFLGINKTFGSGRVHPYLGGGVDYLSATVRISGPGGSIEDSDDSFGGYVHAGILFDVSRVISLGIDGRRLLGTSGELFGISADADYSQVSAVLAIRI